MIIQIVGIYGVPILEPKCHSPSARHRDSIMTFHAAFERMQSKAGKIHSLRTVTSVQRGQDTPKFSDMTRRDLCRSPTLI